MHIACYVTSDTNDIDTIFFGFTIYDNRKAFAPSRMALFICDLNTSLELYSGILKYCDKVEQSCQWKGWKTQNNTHLSASHDTGEILIGFQGRFVRLSDDGKLRVQALEPSDGQLWGASRAGMQRLAQVRSCFRLTHNCKNARRSSLLYSAMTSRRYLICLLSAL